jgi:hypothetical protein
MWSLEFNVSKSHSNKVARFHNVDQKNDYVEAEFKDPTCREAYLRYQAARTPKERHKLAFNLDSTRWKFYENWHKQLHVVKDKPSGDAA